MSCLIYNFLISESIPIFRLSTSESLKLARKIEVGALVASLRSNSPTRSPIPPGFLGFEVFATVFEAHLRAVMRKVQVSCRVVKKILSNLPKPHGQTLSI